MFAKRMNDLRSRLVEQGIDVALITDDDSVYYYTGYYDYLHMEFGRPTILVVRNNAGSVLITPSMEADMADAAAVVDHIELWNDGMGNEWREALPSLLQKAQCVAIEPDQMPPVVRHYFDSVIKTTKVTDITPIIADMRMIKSAAELQLARHAGAVANAMMAAGRDAIGAG
ncbi:MAG: aminopeptidase P family N-terminal domain-containing protein, partial [Gammaproteobacteria bacterium]|nr:aminopeptidase P family N-terminal domain-containing protein [Gammaproteobacteria bacterium]